jgi:hypothetical protein
MEIAGAVAAVQGSMCHCRCRSLEGGGTELSVCTDQEPNFSLGEIRVRVRERGQELADRSIMTINSSVPVVMWIEPGLSC